MSVVDAYDTLTNAWFNCNPLPAPRGQCSAIVILQRYIYLLPGSQRDMLNPNNLTVFLLDAGVIPDLNPNDAESSHYGLPIAKKQWQAIEINDPAFVDAQPAVGISLFNKANNQALVFGGDQHRTQFLIEPHEHFTNLKIAKLDQGFQSPTAFCKGNDHVIKRYNGSLFALDTNLE